MMFDKVLIVGTGLIGGSIGGALLKNRLARQVIGFDRHKKNAVSARALRLITRVSGDFLADVRRADVLVLAVPLSAGAKILKQVAKHVSENCLVMDVGSVKAGIVKAGDKYFPNGQFVGCHPMAGSEKSGPQAGTHDLFGGKKCFVVSGKKSTRKKITGAVRFWKALGAMPVVMPAKDHDRIMAIVSHFPQMVSSALVASLAGKKNFSYVKKYAGSGWRDTTRIAASDEKMWAPVFNENKKNLLPLLTRLRHLLEGIEGAMRSGDLKKIKEMMSRASRASV